MDFTNYVQEATQQNNDTRGYISNNRDVLIESILDKYMQSLRQQNPINELGYLSNNNLNSGIYDYYDKYGFMDIDKILPDEDIRALGQIPQSDIQIENTNNNYTSNNKELAQILAEQGIKATEAENDRLLGNANQALARTRQFAQNAQQNDYSQPIFKSFRRKR